MKLPLSLFVIFVLATAWDRNAVPSVANAEDSDTYEWTNDEGTVTFSDNPMTIPGKYSKQIKTRETVKGEPQQVRLEPDSSPNKVQSKQEVETYGGHDERWWRGQFAGTRAEMERIKTRLESNQENLKTLHHKKVISNSAQTDGLYGNPRKNRENYRIAYEEVREDEKRIKALEQKLIDLENEASRYGVPFEWRK